MPNLAGAQDRRQLPRATQNVSLLAEDHAALRLLAQRERNANISAAVSRLIDEAMTTRYGRDWRELSALDLFTDEES